MSRRNKIILLVLFLLLILFLLWLFFRRTGSQTPEGAMKEQERVPLVREEASEEALPLFLDGEQAILQADIQTMAKVFAERFGSFSSESDFANMKDVLPLMSASYRAQTEDDLERRRAGEDAYAVSTRALSVVIEGEMAEESTQAVARVSTQQEIRDGSGFGARVEYRILVLDFVKEQGVWKVDDAEWES